MINVEQAITNKFPTFASKPALIRKPTLSLLKRLIHENEINQFLTDNQSARGIDFIDSVLNYFKFEYTVNQRDINQIPSKGRVVIIANHPIGSLDGLAILKLVSEVRKDVRIVANDMLMHFENLRDLLIPLDNMTGGSARRSYKRVIESLENEQAIIVFPAGEVSRAHATGVKDGAWRPGFLHFARKSHSPILPVHIKAKNSLLFYGASALFKPLGTALLAHEMFNKHSRRISFSIGEPIPHAALFTDQIQDRTLVKRLKKHVYSLAHKKNNPFATQKRLAAPESPEDLERELASAQQIGMTRDNNTVYLVRYRPHSAVIREIGRLRELTFRAAGEGTGQKRDLDEFDTYYEHLVLWNANAREIAGSYRIGNGQHILAEHGIKGFYTSTLYRFDSRFAEYFAQGVELGRSFVSPKYWGKACLDYLWQGLGAYLAHNPHLRYLIGPVSMSADYPRDLMDTLVFFYRRYYKFEADIVKANHPYLLSTERMAFLDKEFGDRDADAAFDFMQEIFNERGHKLPVLFKQYTALYEKGGFKSLVFSRDPDFGDCLDGLCMGDITYLKPSKAKRYIGEPKVPLNQ
ncbi:GNAT family N-acyltransferase [Teredinibacter turnerae]|uniref:GNAT family N-acyltransferase n=1 Tax=Teredinibacter turnerae TaxID=2426 RepID=UPI000379124B|nr:lysophospholipid acyltransferase family protein [Teredinibacter turnerae]